ncbi:MAG: hypothetical protein Q8K65_09630 [Alphaproteobacteria bacterium]|nr:hypothetical protein [Alphaproteobacteria bacterium]
MSFKTSFSNLGQPQRIWTVSAIRGQLAPLAAIHNHIYEHCRPGDRVLYTGNYCAGMHAAPAETLDELLYFRRSLLARPGMVPEDFVYLRGTQEELWSKILQIHFAPSARAVVEWIAAHHPEMNGLLSAYGSSLDDALRTAREGIVPLTKWTIFLREQMRARAGHEKFFTLLRRAAFTEHAGSNDNNILFVHAGLDPALPLAAQGDRFWWAARSFGAMQTPYHPFRTVIRGCDPDRGGVYVGDVSVSLDGGCGHGGQLVCAQLSACGDVLSLQSA